MPGDRERPLTLKRQRFVEEFLIDLNATAAYKRAGYKGSGNVAEVNAHKLLRDAKVSRAIQAAKEDRTQRTQIASEQVLHELAVLGFSDIRHYALDQHYNLTLREGAPEPAMRAVSSVKHRVYEQYHEGDLVGVKHDVEYRLWDKNAALTNLAKHLGLLVERHEINLTQQHISAVIELSDLALGEFLALMHAKKPELALKLIQGGQSG